MSSGRRSFALSFIAASAGGFIAIAARVQWGFGDDAVGGLMIPWLLLTSVSAAALGLLIGDKRIVQGLRIHACCSVIGGYLASGCPTYFYEGSYYGLGAIIGWFLFALGVLVASAFVTAGMVRVAERGFAIPSSAQQTSGAPSRGRFVQGVAGFVFVLSAAEVVLTRHFERSGALTYLVSRPPDGVVAFVPGAQTFQGAALAICGAALVALMYGTWSTRRERR